MTIREELESLAGKEVEAGVFTPAFAVRARGVLVKQNGEAREWRVQPGALFDESSVQRVDRHFFVPIIRLRYQEESA